MTARTQRHATLTWLRKDPDRISVSQLKLTVDEADRIGRLISRMPSENTGAPGRVIPYPINRLLARKALAISAKPRRKHLPRLKRLG